VEVVPGAPIEIEPGDLVEQGPTEVLNYRFNFDRRNLPASVTIDSEDVTGDGRASRDRVAADAR
jgi:hypothetical protein